MMMAHKFKSGQLKIQEWGMAEYDEMCIVW